MHRLNSTLLASPMNRMPGRCAPLTLALLAEPRDVILERGLEESDAGANKSCERRHCGLVGVYDYYRQSLVPILAC